MFDYTKDGFYSQVEKSHLLEGRQFQHQGAMMLEDGPYWETHLLASPKVELDRSQQAMLAGCLFEDLPKNVLVASHDADIFARYFSEHFMAIQGSAVGLPYSKNEPLQLSSKFAEVNERNWTFTDTPITTFVTKNLTSYDLIILDVLENESMPDWLLNNNFIEHVKFLLSQQGHIAFNLRLKNQNQIMACVSSIRKVFSGASFILVDEEQSNVVVFAYQQFPRISLRQVKRKIRVHSQQWDIDFQSLYYQLLTDNIKGNGIF